MEYLYGRMVTGGRWLGSWITAMKCKHSCFTLQKYSFTHLRKWALASHITFHQKNKWRKNMANHAARNTPYHPLLNEMPLFYPLWLSQILWFQSGKFLMIFENSLSLWLLPADVILWFWLSWTLTLISCYSSFVQRYLHRCPCLPFGASINKVKENS